MQFQDASNWFHSFWLSFEHAEKIYALPPSTALQCFNQGLSETICIRLLLVLVLLLQYPLVVERFVVKWSLGVV